MLEALVRTARLRRGKEAARWLSQLCDDPDLIPSRYWSVARADTEDEAEGEQLLMRGAVLVRVKKKLQQPNPQELEPELAAAVIERPISAASELLRLLRESGQLTLVAWVLAIVAAAGSVVIEAVLFQVVISLAGTQNVRVNALLAVLAFSSLILLLEGSMFSGSMRLGRQVEIGLRTAFLEKIPKLGDRYFQSRLTSDMAERIHTSHRLRRLPDLARQLLRSALELAFTSAGMIWLAPVCAPWVLAASAAALLIPLAAQPALAERDGRVRSHAAGLTRFCLDAMLGLQAIWAHRGERSVRREHARLVDEWSHSVLRLQSLAAAAGALQLTFTLGLIISLFLSHPSWHTAGARLLLLVYWALTLPSLGQELSTFARQYPYARNLVLRLFDPLGAPEEEMRSSETGTYPEAPSIVFENVGVSAAGQTVLEDISRTMDAGTYPALIGASGSGKSSLVGVLLGWLKPNRGEVSVNGMPLDSNRLRRATAWVDPAVQLWNRSLEANLRYGADAHSSPLDPVIDTATLRSVLEALPNGLSTKLGEGGGLLSGGEGQRARFGRALLRPNARLVVLDEPFRGLDRDTRRKLLARAREFWKDATLLCITHDIAETLSFDRVLVMQAGRVVEDDTPERLAANPSSRFAELLRAEEETQARLWKNPGWRRFRLQSGLFRKLRGAGGEHSAESEVA